MIMDDGEYASGRILSAGRVLAGMLTATWIGIALKIGGFDLAIRAFLFFMVPLCFVCMPGLMAHIAGKASRKSLAPDTLVSPATLHFTGWFIILGVPLSWFVFSRI